MSKYRVFSGFLDNHLRYARVSIFNSQIKYTSPNFQYCYDVSFSMNLFNKIKSQLKLSLPFLIFCLGATIIFLSIYILFVIFAYKKWFCCYTFGNNFFLASLNILINKKVSLILLVKSQTSFTNIKFLNNNSFSLNQMLIIWSGDVEGDPGRKKLF